MRPHNGNGRLNAPTDENTLKAKCRMLASGAGLATAAILPQLCNSSENIFRTQLTSLVVWGDTEGIKMVNRHRKPFLKTNSCMQQFCNALACIRVMDLSLYARCLYEGIFPVFYHERFADVTGLSYGMPLSGNNYAKIV